MGDTEKKIVPKYGTFIEAWGLFAEQLRFLANAVSTDETRYFMNFIYVEHSEKPSTDPETILLKAVATDGRRMHIVDPLNPAASAIHGMEPGFWKVVRVGGKSVQIAKMREAPGQFPNYKKVIPSGEPAFTGEFLGFDIRKEGLRRSNNYQNMVDLFRSFPEKTVLNFNYLADLTVGEKWTVGWADQRRAITFKANEKLAVIMPMESY